MADIFLRDDARNLLQGKFVFMLGDSNTRATYKDLVYLLNKNEITPLKEFKRKGEVNYFGDNRICFNELTTGRHYIEGREFCLHDCHIEYHFITKCYTDQIEDFFRKIRDKVMRTPDVVIINSCMWDISRWGPNGVAMFKENMKKLLELLDQCLPAQTLLIWTSALPVSSMIRGGLIVQQIDFLQNTLRFDVMEANLYCRDLIVSHDYNFLDTHHYLRMQIHKRLADGLHFEPRPLRLITNLILTHIALAWDVPLPGNTRGIALDRVIRRSKKSYGACETSPINFPTVPKCLTARNTNVNGRRGWNKSKRRPVGRGRMQQNPRFSFNDRPKPAAQTQGTFASPPPWLNDNAPAFQQQQQRPRQFWMDNTNGNNFASWNGDGAEENRYSVSRYSNFDELPGGPFRRNTKRGARPRPY